MLLKFAFINAMENDSQKRQNTKPKYGNDKRESHRKGVPKYAKNQAKSTRMMSSV